MGIRGILGRVDDRIDFIEWIDKIDKTNIYRLDMGTDGIVKAGTISYRLQNICAVNLPS